jgi:serine/threonine protein kinase
MNSSQDEYFVTSCTGCGKKYRLAKRFLGKMIKCKECQNVWRALEVSEQTGSPGETSELTGTDLSAGGSQLVNSALNAPTTASLNGSSIDDDDSWVGKKLGRFQVVEVLGKGAMGVVFRAHDPDLKRDVALKILAKQFIRSQKKTYRLEQFVREARSAARLSHPHTVTVFEIGQDQGWFFIAMELVEGKTLLDLVRKRKKKVPYEQICELIAEAADALSAAHRLGIVHRDIKPSNIMLTREGRAKVADFGLAQLADTEDDFELPSKAVGTPYWMSPEQCRGQTAVPQSDTYSLGALLFFALTGEVPFKGKTKREILTQHVSTPVPDPRDYRKDIPESLVRVIQRAMAKNPNERFQDAAEMAIALRQIGHSLAQSKMAERFGGLFGDSRPAEARTASHASLRNIAVLFVLLAIIVGLVMYFKYSSPTKQIDRPVKPVLPIDSSAGPQVPVYVIKGTRMYHALGCPTLNDVPPENLSEFPSDKEAEKQSFAGCRYCQLILQQLKEQAKNKSKTTAPAPK